MFHSYLLLDQTREIRSILNVITFSFGDRTAEQRLVSDVSQLPTFRSN